MCFGAKIPNIRQNQCNELNKDFKNGPHQKKILKKMKNNGIVLASVARMPLNTVFYFRK